MLSMIAVGRGVGGELRIEARLGDLNATRSILAGSAATAGAERTQQRQIASGKRTAHGDLRHVTGERRIDVRSREPRGHLGSAARYNRNIACRVRPV